MSHVDVSVVTKFLRQRTNPRRRREALGTVFVSPNMTELRRWLHDKTIPKEIRNHIYDFIRYRQHRAAERCTGRVHPSVIAQRRAIRRQYRIVERAANRASKEFNRSPVQDNTWGRQVLNILLGR